MEAAPHPPQRPRARSGHRCRTAAPTMPYNPPGGVDWAFFEKYCTECHNATDWAGGVAFDTLTPDNIGERREDLGSTPYASCAGA